MTDKSALDETWEQMSTDWKQQPVKHIDSKKLLFKIKRRVMLSKLVFTLNILATIGCLFGCFWGFFIADWPLPTVAFLGFGGFASIFFVHYEYQIRRKLWQFKEATPEQAVLDAIESCESSIRYCKLNLIALAPLFIAGNLFVIASAREAEESAIPGLIYVNILSAAIAVFFLILRKRRKQELNQLQKMQVNTSDNPI